MSCLVVKSGGRRGFADVSAELSRVRPDLEVVAWDDAALDPARVDYAFVWSPEPGGLARFSNLKVIFSSAAGVDHITRDPDWPRHVPIVRMGAADTARQMCDFVLWAALSLLRDARRYAVQQSEARWNRPGDPARMAHETRVGIMGLGNLGADVSRHLAHAGFAVSGWSRTAKQIDGVTCHAGPEGLEQFLPTCDILVCLLPDTEHTRGLIDGALLRRLRAPAGFINVGRGPQVVEADLLAALDDGTIGGAVLDVFCEEPLPSNSPFWSHPKVMVTPHIASEASFTARAAYVGALIDRFEAGDTDLPLRYDADAGY
ncbi:D-isomer specific 2-hydroxyacid dehydrogenase [Ameyamaea chiangmaiensis NBRC 103196]|uniref:Glyoxylate/hydroxypyruvate reductase A n=1 Tax=Ameyamaea chiangmaiensis TaxID=442969 RepID=A0A850P973_9PROT|nr:glyoxylate/hydroxypyruvate reductase A [Ameyamaea chiangmaiensis]MBS4075087.1 glyoxylate/hydroxypyruvate reductase A [Ameyamaea chiangmaiensis]NVN40554.1 glyoxylate/hydroxypyruvate reductase A [Ameyamaea chiangmaiensis]GBQ65513.1 D-isomer specific 2-hydroxyacid dehydrogenase [Ameyamaea chiangmaiensis NBRC 103196]